MNRREFLMTTLAAFALSALPKLTFADKIAVSEAVKSQINPKNKLGFGFMRLPLKNPADQTSIDYDTLNRWWILSWTEASLILTRLGCIWVMKAKMRSESLWWKDIREISLP